jgi:hypothetical protein
MKSETSMEVTLPSIGVQKTEVTQTIDLGVTADGSTGNKLVKVTFSGIKAHVSAAGQNMDYDSADPAKSGGPLAASMGALLNKGFTMVFDKDDKFVEARDVSNVGVMPGMEPKKMAEMFRKSFDMGLPADPIAPGETWNSSDKMDLGPAGSIDIAVTGKLDSIVDKGGHKQAKILIDGKMSSPEGAAGPAKIGEGSKMHGESYFDLDQRLATNSESTADINVSVGAQNMPMTQKSKVTVTPK